MTSAEASRYWLQESIAHIRANPLADLKLTGKKLLLFFSDYEIPDNHNYYFHKRYSGVLQNLPLGFILLAPFFLPGFLAMLVSKRRGPLLLFFVQATYVVSVVVFFVVSRYRLVALPLFCLSAGYGMFLLQQQARLGRWRHFCLGLLLATGGFWLARQQPLAPFDFSHSFTDAGLAYEVKGEPVRAMAAYRRALTENPAALRALENLARLQLQQEQYQAARRTYRRLLVLDPESVDAKYQIMRLDKLGY
jgi:tetratricopeptide (TPR) repeat protein